MATDETDSPQFPAMVESMEGMSRAEALTAGHRCMARARIAFAEGSDKQNYSRMERSGLRYDTATFWSTRATAFYALAAVLPIS